MYSAPASAPIGPETVRSPGARGLSSMPSPPRALVVLSGLVVLVCAGMALLGAFRTGVTWDEPYHVMRLRNFLDHGWYALDWSLGAGSATDVGSGPGFGENNTAVYAPVTALLLHGLAVLTGVEGWAEVSTSPAAYDVRHLGIALIGLAGTAAAAGITRIVTGSRRWALVTAALLLALPMWTGHLMFNIKDVPVATGYTLVTLALVMMVAPVQSRRRFRIGCLAGGVVLMVGTRPGMVVAVVLALAVLGVGVLAAGRFGNARTAIAEAGAAVALGYGVLLLVYPRLFAHPTHLLRSAEQSRSFRDGQDAVYGYVPFHVLFQVPLLLQAGFVAGLITSIGFVVRHGRIDTAASTRIGLVAAQVCALPLVAVVGHSDLYNGLRQLLFASPAWAVLATLGVARLLGRARDRGHAVTGTSLALLALAAPVLAQLQLFPYQYTYFNAAMDASGIHVPSDYWRTSVPELLPDIPRDGQIVCGPTRTLVSGNSDPSVVEKATGDTRGDRFAADSSVDCRTDPLGPLASIWTAAQLPLRDDLPHGDYYVLIDRDHPVPVNCRRVAEVDRPRHLSTIRMTYIGRCHLDPSLLGTEQVTFDQSPAERTMAPAKWAYLAEGWVKRGSWSSVDSGAGSATLTFSTPVACATSRCDLVLDGGVPEDLTAIVNDAGAAVRTVRDGAAITLPTGTDAAWVVLRRSGGADLDIHLRGARVVPEQ